MSVIVVTYFSTYLGKRASELHKNVYHSETDKTVSCKYTTQAFPVPESLFDCCFVALVIPIETSSLAANRKK